MIEPKIEIILYVKNQERSKEFYALLFGKDPVLDVPGMVEFQVSDDFKLGLMLETSIVKIIEDRLPHPNLGNGIPRCELYFKVQVFALIVNEFFVSIVILINNQFLSRTKLILFISPTTSNKA